MIAEYAVGGGFIFGASQIIQCNTPRNTPPENVAAMFDAAYEYGRYPIRKPEKEKDFLGFIEGLNMEKRRARLEEML